MRTRSAPSLGFWRRTGRFVKRLFTGSGRRAYEGASRGRRFSGWNPSNTSANAEIGASLEMLRARSRSITRDEPFAARAIELLSRNLVGAAGLNVRAVLGDPEAEKRIGRLWRKWIKRCDVTGVFGLHAIFKLVARELFEAGEVLLRRRRGPTKGRQEIPLGLEVIEADQLDFYKNALLDAGGRIQHGVEFSGRGEVVAYWILPNHPGNTSALGSTTLGIGLAPSVRVPADEIIHLFQRLRAGQVRGVPASACVLTAIRDFGDYDQATRLRKKLEACLMAFITPSDQFLQVNAEEWNELSPDDPARQNHQPRAVNADGAVLEDLQPGMVVTLPNGKQVTFHTPQGTAGEVEYENQKLRAIAAGFGVTFEQLTGNLSQVNYSSYRAGLIEFRGMIESLQWELFIPICCERIWEWWCEAAWAVSKVPSPDIEGEWTTAKWLSVDPLKDAEANALNVEKGFVAQEDVIAEHGYDPLDYVDRVVAFNDVLVAKGLKAPTPDVQKTALNGAQVEALKALASDAAAGLIPVETAKQIALAAFPIDEKAAAAIFTPLEGFVPTSANEPSPSPPAEDTAEPAKNAA